MLCLVQIYFTKYCTAEIIALDHTMNSESTGLNWT